MAVLTLRRPRGAILALAVMLALAGCAAPSGAGTSLQVFGAKLTGPCGPTLGFGNVKWSPDGSQIAFDRYEGGDVQVAAMDASGKQLRYLTTTHGFNGLGGWWPDGRRLVFMSNRDASYQVYAMSADGSAQTRLTQGGSASLPAVSPDGGSILYTSLSDARRGAIFRIDADGSHPQRISDPYADAYLPAWSPDGAQIAYVTVVGDVSLVYVMNRDGGGAHAVSRTPASHNPPFWSPDGREVAFLSRRVTGGALTTALEVARADASGSVELAVTPADTLPYWPSWSPDSRQIAFVASWNSSEEIALIGRHGEGETQLTHSLRDDYAPSWSPDGRTIAFISARDGAPEIYRMDAGGSHQTRLTANPANQQCLKWPF